MRKLILSIALLSSSQVWAQTQLLKQATPKKSKMTLTFEAETANTRDRENLINGAESWMRIEPGYKWDNQNLKVGADYWMRNNFEDGLKESTALRKNRDELFEVYTKYNYKYKIGSWSNRFQTRLVYLADPVFREYYGNDANLQFRNYFGKKFGGGFIIDKYVTYVRFKQYFANKFAGDRSRMYEMRARVTPAYEFNRDLKLGMTVTYNHIEEASAKLSQDIDMGFSARYAFGNMAVVGIADWELYKTDSDDVLAPVVDAMGDTTFRLNFAYYAL